MWRCRVGDGHRKGRDGSPRVGRRLGRLVRGCFRRVLHALAPASRVEVRAGPGSDRAFRSHAPRGHGARARSRVAEPAEGAPTTMRAPYSVGWRRVTRTASSPTRHQIPTRPLTATPSVDDMRVRWRLASSCSGPTAPYPAPAPQGAVRSTQRSTVRANAASGRMPARRTRSWNCFRSKVVLRRPAAIPRSRTISRRPTM
jgi:hypothetical protein